MNARELIKLLLEVSNEEVRIKVDGVPNGAPVTHVREASEPESYRVTHIELTCSTPIIVELTTPKKARNQ